MPSPTMWPSWVAAATPPTAARISAANSRMPTSVRFIFGSVMRCFMVFPLDRLWDSESRACFSLCVCFHHPLFAPGQKPRARDRSLPPGSRALSYGLRRHHRASCTHAVDSSLDRRADGRVWLARDVVGEHLVHEVLRRHPADEVRIDVAAVRHDVDLGAGG